MGVNYCERQRCQRALIIPLVPLADSAPPYILRFHSDVKKADN